MFVKAPVAGQVKTRLIPELGDQGAADFYKRLASRVAADVEKGAGDWPVVLCADDTEDGWVRALAGQHGFELMPQGDGDLGARMGRCLGEALERFDAAILVGSDCPGYDTEYLSEAKQALRQHGAVLGPAMDGGYVLIGLARAAGDRRGPAGLAMTEKPLQGRRMTEKLRPGRGMAEKPCHSARSVESPSGEVENRWSNIRALFEDIEWSTHKVFETQLERLNSAGLSAHVLPARSDIDMPEDALRLNLWDDWSILGAQSYMNNRIEIIARELSNNANIAVAWLYGSRANGTATDSSDYDLAVALHDSVGADEKIDLLDDVQHRLSQLVDVPVSVVDINRVPVPLAYEVISKGTAFVVKNELRLRTEEQRIWSLWSEYKFEHEQYRQAL